MILSMVLRGWRSYFMKIIVYLVGAILLSWPLIGRATEAIPLGSEAAPTVPYFNTWTVGWNVNRLAHGYQGYWDAPIFHPVPATFAFSEPQPLTGVLAAPLWWLSPALAYNAILLLYLVLNGMAAYQLQRQVGLPVAPALLGGFVVMALPFLAYERGVLQLQPLFGVLWALAGLRRMAVRQDRWATLSLGLGSGVTFLTSETYALFLALVLIPAAAFFLPTILRRKQVRFLIASMGLAALLVVPVAWPQLQILRGMDFARSFETVAGGSASWQEYLQIPHQIRSHSWLPLADGGGRHLFPGFVLLAAAIGGAAVGVRTPNRQRWTLFLCVTVGVAFSLSLGLNLRVGPWSPFDWLRETLPGLDSLRSPFRFAYFVQLFLALLAPLAMERLWLGRRSLALVVFGLFLIETWPAPARMTPVPAPINTQVLTPPVLFLPFTDGRETGDYAETVTWMAATIQDVPVALVNGYSGYFPRLNGQLRILLTDFPTEGGLYAARSLGVQTIAIRQGWVSPAQLVRLEAHVAQGDLQWIGEQQGYLIFGLSNSRLSPAHSYDGEWALQATVEEKTLTIAAYAAVTDRSMYVLAPGIAPLRWSVEVVAEDGAAQRVPVKPGNAMLLYHGSDRWPRVTIPRPDRSGALVLVLRETLTGRVLGRTSVELP